VSGQTGPVEPGRPPVVAMDLDRAVAVLFHLADPRKPGQADEMHEAQAALQALVDAARAYVKGPTSGRLVALAQVLQEPVPEDPRPVNAETVVQAWLTERGLVVISRDAAARLGIIGAFP